MRITNEPIAKQLYGSKVKRRILQYLLSQQGMVSERELSRIIGVSHTAVNKAMRQLLELNVVKGRSVGAAMTWEMNEKSLAFPYVKALIEASNVSPLELVKRDLKKTLEFANMWIEVLNTAREEERPDRIPKIAAAYIFGSVAAGTPSPISDLDILVLLEFECHDKNLLESAKATIGEGLLELTGNRASFHIYPVDAVKRNQPPWLKDAIKDGIRVI